MALAGHESQGEKPGQGSPPVKLQAVGVLRPQNPVQLPDDLDLEGIRVGHAAKEQPWVLWVRKQPWGEQQCWGALGFELWALQRSSTTPHTSV